jgi:hypothetical protein
MPVVRGDGDEIEQLSAINYKRFDMIVLFDVKL